MRIRYVFYGQAERDLAGEAAASPEWANSLTVIYSEGGYLIYERADR
jgi:hypothetical protein